MIVAMNLWAVSPWEAWLAGFTPLLAVFLAEVFSPRARRNRARLRRRRRAERSLVWRMRAW